ncbi:MAG: hypothetical protein IJS73_08200, partial [Paludibacteraceae bacterium]|nr:hypothetical protein [Paludibacteraceae bacterium]
TLPDFELTLEEGDEAGAATLPDFELTLEEVDEAGAATLPDFELTLEEGDEAGALPFSFPAQGVSPASFAMSALR